MVRSFTHGATLAYRSYGSGPVHVLAFPGFGRTGADFAVLEAAFGRQCTVHAFDLPFHGESPKPRERTRNPYPPGELARFFTAFVNMLDRERVVLLGYSLGGRLALSLLEQMPERVSHLVLLAPDGLRSHPWYRAAAKYRFGRWLYARFVEKPTLARALTRLLYRHGPMNERMYRFLEEHMATREVRQLVHDVWLSFRLLEPDLARVGALLREHGIPAHLVFGARDRVIPPSLGQGLRRDAPQQVRITVVEAGHALLTPAVMERLAETGLLE